MRFNDEVRVIMTVRTTRAVTKGEVVSSSDFSEHISIELTDHDANGGRITLVLHQNRWWVTWDLRYNAQRISETVKAAQEFIAAAHFSGERSHARSFIDTLFSAVELLAKAELLSLPDKQLLDAKTHGSVRSRFNLWTRTGSIDRDFSGLLNTLDSMRDPARYGLQPWSLTPDEMTSLLTRAEKMLDAVASRVPRRGKVSDAGGPA